MRKLIIIISVIIIGIITYNYIYKDHRDIKAEASRFNVSSIDINNEFVIDLKVSEQKYLNKTIEVSGEISEINKNDLTLDEHVFCVFDNPFDIILKIQTKIKIKGRVIGYDDLLEQVKLDQCTIIN